MKTFFVNLVIRADRATIVMAREDAFHNTFNKVTQIKIRDPPGMMESATPWILAKPQSFYLSGTAKLCIIETVGRINL